MSFRSGIHADDARRRLRADIVGRPHSGSYQPMIPSPTWVGGARRAHGVRSSCDKARIARAEVRIRRPDPARRARERSRGRVPRTTRRTSRRTTRWLAAPAIALVVLPLLARRRFPFAAPAAVWLLATALSFADGRLVVVHRHPVHRRDGRCVPARRPPRRHPGASRSGGHARLRRSSSSTTTPTTRPASSSSPRCCSGSAGSPASRCASGPSGPRPRSSVRRRPSGSGRRRRASPSPRSARGSHASSTTSSPTRSA